PCVIARVLLGHQTGSTALPQSSLVFCLVAGPMRCDGTLREAARLTFGDWHAGCSWLESKNS
ncbi:MAG TPA: hypothetical protein VKP30_05460, partial [Polyangiaceae bacterium]|nr:hypothetical protein [Polyangiaceae bacterium]